MDWLSQQSKLIPDIKIQVFFAHKLQVSVAFPGSNALRWQVADSSRTFQDEYLEWSSNRDDDSNILSATFTCEGPEVWLFLQGLVKNQVANVNTVLAALRRFSAR